MLEQTTEASGILTADLLRSKFEAGLHYADYVAAGKPDQQESWGRIYSQASLSDDQRSLVEGFTREMRLIALSGVWCGDCAQQCPLLARIAEANPAKVHLRFLDRDEHADLARRVPINAGLRVPTVIFAAEDFEFLGLLGDRTLTRYRAMAARRLGAACPLPGAPVPTDELRATLQDWLGEVERMQLLLRLSPRLRERHAD